MQQHHTRNKVGLVGVNACFAALNLFVSVFLTARIFQLADNQISAVVLFILTEATALILFYAFSSAICKHIRSPLVILAATILVCFFILLTILFESDLGRAYILFGALWGAVEGLYWGACNFTVAEAFPASASMSYFVWYLSFVSAIKVIFPVTFGYAIDLGSFALTAVVVLGIGVLQIVFALLIKTEKPRAGRLRMATYFRALRSSKFLAPMIFLWCSTFLAGFPFVLGYLVTVLVIQVYGSNINLGIIGSIAAVTAVCSLVTYKCVPARIRPVMFWISSALPLAVSVVLFFYVGPASIILFQFGTILRNLFETEECNNRSCAARYFHIKRGGTGQIFNAESLLFLESALWSGRVVACGLLLIAAFIGTALTLAAAISFAGACVLVSAVMLSIWKKEHAWSEVKEDNILE
jgi:hypothetical protein